MSQPEDPIPRPPRNNGPMALLLCALVAGLIWYAYGGGRAAIVRVIYGLSAPRYRYSSQDAQRAVELVKAHRALDAQVTVSQRLDMLQSWLKARGIKLKTESWRSDPAPDMGPRTYRVKYLLDGPDWSRTWLWNVSLLGSRVQPANDAAGQLQGPPELLAEPKPKPSPALTATSKLPPQPRQTPSVKAQPLSVRLLGVVQSGPRAVALLDVKDGLREAVPGDVLDGWLLQSAVHREGGASYVVLQRGGDRRTVRIGEGSTPPAVLNLPAQQAPASPLPQESPQPGPPLAQPSAEPSTGANDVPDTSAQPASSPEPGVVDP